MLDALLVLVVVFPNLVYPAGPLSLLAPLYKACYGPIPNATAAGAGQEQAGCMCADGLLRPSFIPADQLPLLEITVDVAGRQLPVEVFKMEHMQESCGQPRTFYLVQSELFR